MTQSAFPFPAIAGMDRARRALLLLAVEPKLKGLLLAAGRGTAKSLLARSFRALQPRGAPFVEVPLGVTEDSLLGGLSLERTLLTGRRQLAEGLLARADGGVLYVDGINLLHPSLVHHIAAALKTGSVRVERDGISAVVPAGFVFIGTFDPDEGEISPSLRDVAGLHVRETARPDADARAEVLGRVAAFDRDPRAFAARYTVALRAIAAKLAAARNRLPQIAIDAGDYQRLSLTALRLGVEGHRPDVYAALCARACAALDERASVHENDLQAAVDFVLGPRATPVAESRESLPSGDTAAAPEPAHREDAIIQPLDTDVPPDALDTRGSLPQAGRGRTKARDAAASNRGRYVRAVTRRPQSPKIAIDATLRAAAARGVSPLRIEPGDLRFKQFRQKSGTLVIFAVDASGSMAMNRMNQAKGALLRLLQRAYLHRDKAALISFRGDRAEVLLPPTRAVERAKRALDALPAGGGTPLAAGLEAALQLARSRPSLLVLLTDGRPNVGLGTGPGIWQELEAICLAFRSSGSAALVVDTSHRAVPGDGAERLAGLLGANYLRLPRPDASAIYDAISLHPG